ncbi:outer membrane protein assembly factor [Mucilaginibacter sp. RB4R14]|uniref:translocation and assembly module lipoprotein TamL n=1 Tax=Mucilaginibacter aurantiaciroseus TaxID=2949308 RepID=UPI0020908F24|nr:BamA/TamA family outer membrane protein [Mucilaginibacter aurantiaciroseus]MCO5934302.1 outer membrane protein assembly factor [Mucilaginibacter aurantiaciroseus]
MVIIGAGCSVTRGLKDNQVIVRKVTIKGIDKEFSEAAINYVDKEQQPNNWLNLQFYYLFSNKGKRKIGEAPALLDSNLVEFSRLQIQKYLVNKGYLKAKVADSIVVKKSKAQLYFTATQGPLFKIRNSKDSIYDAKVRQLYRDTRKQYSHVNTGSRYDTDSLAYDRDQFYQVMKRNGYYDFYRQYISYTPDSSYKKSVVDLVMIIDNPADKKEHPIYTINNTLITIARSNGRMTGKADTIQVDSQFRFVDYSGRFKPRTVIDYTFQKKGEIYNLDKQTLTTARLSELNVFRNVPNPTYEKLPDSTNRLNSKIDIVPLKQMTDRLEAEFLFNQGRFGYNLGNTFTNRNIFKQAAILQVKLNWSILFDNGNSSVNQGIQNQDFRAGVNLIYPRLLLPFRFPNLAKFGIPHTTFSTNFQLFYQKGLVERRSFINSITYDFFETARKQHSVTPLSIEFSSGTIDPIAKAELLKQNRFSYVYLIGRTTFTTSSQYTFQYNAQELNSYKNFIYFRGGVEIGGNILSLLSNAANTPRDSLGQRTVFGYAFTQYVKTEIDYRWYRSLGGEKQFIFRFNPGIGIPYGNSRQLVFEKNFYTGGANDIRAWLPRTLGPGQFNRESYGVSGGADTARARLKYLDQFGEIKIVANAEYRFKLADNFFGTKLKGAFFVDAGNVWRLHKQVENPNGEFRFNNLWNSTAIGIGTGLRFDLAFFIFRLDAAFKFKDPQFNGSDQWVFIKHFNEVFRNGSFKESYLRNNKTGVDTNGKIVGDGYSFMQLNFGIGLPF